MVAVKGNVTADDGTTTTAGHVPRKLSAICSIFIRRGGIVLSVARVAILQIFHKVDLKYPVT